jgi:hypothetical protein
MLKAIAQPTLLVAVGVACVLAGPRPSLALSAELAKKCEGMAIKAHPPKPAGTGAYAQAEREYFRKCIANKGNMDDAH